MMFICSCYSTLQEPTMLCKQATKSVIFMGIGTQGAINLHRRQQFKFLRAHDRTIMHASLVLRNCHYSSVHKLLCRGYSYRWATEIRILPLSLALPRYNISSSSKQVKHNCSVLLPMIQLGTTCCTCKTFVIRWCPRLTIFSELQGIFSSDFGLPSPAGSIPRKSGLNSKCGLKHLISFGKSFIVVLLRGCWYPAGHL